MVELAKGTQCELAADKLGLAITEKLGDRVGGVAHLRQSMDIEIVDLDAVAGKDEVLVVVRSVIPGDSSNRAATSERDAITLTRLWSTRAG